MKKLLGLLLISSFLLFGCTSTPTNSTTGDHQVLAPTANNSAPGIPNISAGTPSGSTNLPVLQNASREMNVVISSEAHTSSTIVPAVREFTITAKQWEFQPATITVKKGDHVKLTITTTDVTHGFSLPDFNVNSQISPGSPTVVEFDADKTGTFTFACSVFCGSGHGGMHGTLVVTD